MDAPSKEDILFSLTSSEYHSHVEFSDGNKDFHIIKSSKVLGFHSTSSGRPFISMFTLFVFYLLGYDFLTCHPFQTKKNIIFGRFLFPFEKGVIYDTSTRVTTRTKNLDDNGSVVESHVNAEKFFLLSSFIGYYNEKIGYYQDEELTIEKSVIIEEIKVC